jgi:hypothetical protein
MRPQPLLILTVSGLWELSDSEIKQQFFPRLLCSSCSRIQERQSISYKARCLIRLLTVLSPAYTLPGGEPSISDTMASRAILIFWNEPMMWILLKDNWEVGFRWAGKDARVGKDNTSSTGIFNREFGFSILTCYTACGAGQQAELWNGVHAYLPIARDRWSPCRVFTSLISKESR